jgi:hypothetical protein
MRFSPLPLVLAGLWPTMSQAQAPTLLSTVPGRHSLAGSRTAPIQLTFSQAVAAPASIRVNGNMQRGQRPGTLSGAGTAQLAFQPAQAFAPGESVSITVPASVSSPAEVVEFRAATGRGAATFSAPYTIEAPLNPQPAVSAAGDLDHDGDLDLLVVNYGTSAGQVCLNNSNGRFAPQATTVAISPRATSLRLADVNGDGNLDAISYALATLGGGVAINLGTGLGTFLPKSQFSGGFTATTGDFNADGITDLVVGDIGGTNAVLRLVPGNTAGVFNPTLASFTTVPIRELGTADMDEDGDLDLLVSTGDQLAVYVNNGSGQFTAGAVRSLSQSFGGITVGDFNGDGHADVACSSSSSADVSLLLGTGTGGLQPAQSISALSRTRHVSSGDLDGDGDLDLIVTNDRGITQTLLNNGRAQFSAASAILIGYEPFNVAEAADLNGDGSLDIYTGHSTFNGAAQHGLDIFFNQPPTITATATARPALVFSLGPNPAQQQVAISLPPGGGAASFELRDALGRLVKSWPAQRPTADGAVLLSLTDVAPGVYSVLGTTATHRGTQRLMVQ